MAVGYETTPDDIARYVAQHQKEYDLGDGRTVIGVPEKELVGAFDGDDATIYSQAYSDKDVSVRPVTVSATHLPEEYHRLLGYGQEDGTIFFYSKA